jgi:F-type H+-transporting ATPase subunit epsilon
MKVTILSPETTLFSGEASLLRLPGAKGPFEVLNHHAPIITTLSAGDVSLEGENPFRLTIAGGFAQVSGDEATVCVEPSARQEGEA